MDTSLLRKEDALRHVENALEAARSYFIRRANGHAEGTSKTGFCPVCGTSLHEVLAEAKSLGVTEEEVLEAYRNAPSPESLAQV